MNTVANVVVGALVVIIIALGIFVAVISKGKILDSMAVSEEGGIEMATTEDDLCKNIEGVQTQIPDGMKNDNDGYCDGEETVRTIIETREVASPSSMTTSSQVQIVPIVEEVQSDESTRLVNVKVTSANTFDTYDGYYQDPATVGYKLENTSASDITINEVVFKVKPFGSHQISPDVTGYSVSIVSGAKEPGFYIGVYGDKPIYHDLDESILIPAYSSKTIFINVWEFTGDLNYEEGKKTIFTLMDVNSIMEDVTFNIPTGGLVTEIQHI